jgi:hypothetical protein
MRCEGRPSSTRISSKLHQGVVRVAFGESQLVGTFQEEVIDTEAQRPQLFALPEGLGQYPRQSGFADPLNAA